MEPIKLNETEKVLLANGLSLLATLAPEREEETKVLINKILQATVVLRN